MQHQYYVHCLYYDVIWYQLILPVSFRVASLALRKSCDCSSDGEGTLKDMPYTRYIHDLNSESLVWMIVTNHQTVCISIWFTMEFVPDLCVHMLMSWHGDTFYITGTLSGEPLIMVNSLHRGPVMPSLVVRRAGLLWSQRDFEWRWSVPLFKCLTVLEFSFILFDLCLLITFFNFIMNYVPIVTFWIFTYHKIWILSIMFCFIWSYWIIYFLACLEVSWRVVS